jgi:hypothetical protein
MDIDNQPAHDNPTTTLREHVVGMLTVGDRDDLILHMGGPIAGHDDDEEQLEKLDLHELRSQHVERHGVHWQTAQAWVAEHRVRQATGDDPVAKAVEAIYRQVRELFAATIRGAHFSDTTTTDILIQVDEAVADRFGDLVDEVVGPDTWKHIVAAGNPFDGLRLFGGFDDHQEMEDWTDQHLQGEHWWYPTVLGAHSVAARVGIEELHTQS